MPHVYPPVPSEQLTKPASQVVPYQFIFLSFFLSSLHQSIFSFFPILLLHSLSLFVSAEVCRYTLATGSNHRDRRNAESRWSETRHGGLDTVKNWHRGRDQWFTCRGWWRYLHVMILLLLVKIVDTHQDYRSRIDAKVETLSQDRKIASWDWSRLL